MKIFTSKNQKTGELGEDETVKYLENKGFRVIERNYTRKWGEIDVVAKKGNVLHFVEVKAITVRDMFSREIFYRPEDHMDSWKIKRLKKILQTYLMNKNIPEDQEWQFDLACVYLRLKQTSSKVCSPEQVLNTKPVLGLKQTSSKVCSPERPDGQDVLGEVELLKVEWVEDIIL
jgi:putative endonuclease